MEIGVQGLNGGRLFIPNTYLNEGLATIVEVETIEKNIDRKHYESKSFKQFIRSCHRQ
jgi:hypothetical protein